ncbi:MAG TPA: ribosome biogenesis GTP-binding protein YihA/YsxC [Ignavibacteriaceae bacterium]|nr:ribosome biogenesis GTP-binding protein YihA/YsxC [Ignavibacteriaceae bacterium]
MFKKQIFVTSVFDLKNIPAKKLPEIVLCGRSNVGKSSLINSLFNRKELAKISSTPGKTRSINYYEIDDSFYVVDLPGFGYAKISKKEREYWSKLISEFFSQSNNIKLVIHLIDSRHKPTNLDVKLNEMLNHQSLPYIFLLSKADKLKQAEIKSAEINVKSVFSEVERDVNMLFYSSVKGRGKKQLRQLVASIIYNK